MTDYPLGMRLVVDRHTRELPDGSLLGGSPRRLVRLTPEGRRAFDTLRSDPVTTREQAAVARRLTDRGMLHPVVDSSRADATVLIPTKDRADALDVCLGALGNAHPVVVVDDGSSQPELIAKVCAEHGARYLQRTVNGGPAAARNTGLAEINTEFVLLLDSDCIPSAGLVEALGGHFLDPKVAAVAPRVTGDTDYLSPLDLGADPASVTPGRAVSFVPTAALMVRRSALPRFDEALRWGEDVDAVWRLVEAGHVVRYDPCIVVTHTEPRSWLAVMRRRFRYGTSAAPLASRHPGAVPPLVVHPWSALVIAGILARKPLLSAVGAAGAYREVRAVPGHAARAALVARSASSSWLGLSRCSAQFALPAALLAGRRHRRLVVLLLSAPIARWWHQRTLDPARFAVAEIGGDAAYGLGVITGSLRTRTFEPLRPVSTRRPATKQRT